MMGGLLFDDPSLVWRVVATAAIGGVLTVVGLAIATFGRDVVRGDRER